MKTIGWTTLTGLMVLTSLSPGQNTMQNGVAAVVNSEAITYRDVLAQTQREEDDLRNQRANGRITKEEFMDKVRARRNTVLDSLIETKLILQDYKKRDTISPTTILTGKKNKKSETSLAETAKPW